MRISTRWIGEAVAPLNLVDGDLAVFEVGSSRYLCLKASSKEESFVIVLREFGKPSGDPLPRLVYLDTVLNVAVARRLTGGELIVTPIAEDPEVAFKYEDRVVPNGALCILPEGLLIMRVGPGNSQADFDLRSGEQLVTSQRVRLWQHHWRLVWAFGDHEMELCKF